MSPSKSPPVPPVLLAAVPSRSPSRLCLHAASPRPPSSPNDLRLSIPSGPFGPGAAPAYLASSTSTPLLPILTASCRRLPPPSTSEPSSVPPAQLLSDTARHGTAQQQLGLSPGLTARTGRSPRRSELRCTNASPRRSTNSISSTRVGPEFLALCGEDERKKSLYHSSIRSVGCAIRPPVFNGYLLSLIRYFDIYMERVPRAERPEGTDLSHSMNTKELADAHSTDALHRLSMGMSPRMRVADAPAPASVGPRACAHGLMQWTHLTPEPVRAMRSLLTSSSSACKSSRRPTSRPDCMFPPRSRSAVFPLAPLPRRSSMRLPWAGPSASRSLRKISSSRSGLPSRHSTYRSAGPPTELGGL